MATEKDDDAGLPLYRYGWVQRALISFPTASYYYSADKGEKDPTPVLQAHERFNLNPFQPFMMDVTLPDESVGRSTTLATIGKALPRVLHFRRDASWAIEVAPGMDLVGMLCFALSVNQIMEDIKEMRTIKDDGGSGVVPLWQWRIDALAKSTRHLVNAYSMYQLPLNH